MKTSGRKFPSSMQPINANITGTASQKRTASDYIFGKAEIIHLNNSFGLWLNSCTAIFNIDSGVISFRINCNLIGIKHYETNKWMTHYIGSYEKLTKEEFEDLYAKLSAMSEDEMVQYSLNNFGTT